MDSGIVSAICDTLAQLESQESICVLWAVESGSRAWGFPSPDSDYDCRFIYLRPTSAYLSLFPIRDVIELPIQSVYDINGWDLPKAIKLMLKGNAVILEWLLSPIVYRGDAAFRDDFLKLANQIVEPCRLQFHYLHLAQAARKVVQDEEGQFRLKKLFYMLRPAMALRFLRLNPSERIPPMNFMELMDRAEIPSDLRGELQLMIHEKAQTREKGTGNVPLSAVRFFETEIGMVGNGVVRPTVISEEKIVLANQFLLDAIQRFAP